MLFKSQFVRVPIVIELFCALSSFGEYALTVEKSRSFRVGQIAYFDFINSLDLAWNTFSIGSKLFPRDQQKRSSRVHYSLREIVADAVLSQRPDWVILISLQKAEKLIEPPQNHLCPPPIFSERIGEIIDFFVGCFYYSVTTNHQRSVVETVSTGISFAIRDICRVRIALLYIPAGNHRGVQNVPSYYF